MPLQKVGDGYRWGDSGKVHYGKNDKEKAMLQGRAIEASKNKDKKK